MLSAGKIALSRLHMVTLWDIRKEFVRCESVAGIRTQTFPHYVQLDCLFVFNNVFNGAPWDVQSLGIIV